MYDIIIIGAGVTGCAVARSLSRYKAKICVLEKEEDVCCGTSKANSGIVHAGYDALPGTLKAKMNILGNEMMEPLSKELDFPFERIGSFVICTDEGKMDHLRSLYERGMENGVQGLRILSGEEVLEMEPNVTENVVAALYAPTAGIVCPFSMNIAFAENAVKNGVEFQFDTEVEEITREEGQYTIRTAKGDFAAKCVVNAAGVYADRFHNMVSSQKLTITPRKGEYCLLDKSAGGHVARTIFTLPGKYGKGVLVTPTVHGNLLVGPTSTDIMDKEDVSTTCEGMEELAEKAEKSVHGLPMRDVITSFTGLRAHEAGEDFIIGEVEDAPGFYDCAGIASPGLTSAPAIGYTIAELLKEKMELPDDPEYDGRRKGILNPQKLSIEERNELIRKNPAYGNMICRCEMITEGEIIDAIRRPLGARSLDGVKRRTRAGMGRCQSGFCMPRTMEILARELKIRQQEITKCGGESKIITGSGRMDKETGR